MINYKVIFSMYYFERTLFLLEFSGELLDKKRYAMVYRSSGLNKGRKGRFIPFHYLLDGYPRLFIQNRMSVLGNVPGYINKSFYYKGKLQYHHKNVETFGNNIKKFMIQIEKDLDNINYDVDYEEYNVKKVLAKATVFNNKVDEFLNEYNILDWYILNSYNKINYKGK